jgi:hypothetical protein
MTVAENITVERVKGRQWKIVQFKPELKHKAPDEITVRDEDGSHTVRIKAYIGRPYWYIDCGLLGIYGFCFVKDPSLEGSDTFNVPSNEEPIFMGVIKQLNALEV